MRIGLFAPELKSKTGMPMYVENMAKSLKEVGHEVECYDYDDRDNIKGKYDIAIIHSYAPLFLEIVEADHFKQVIHSMNECDEPLQHTKIDYIVPREQISDYWGIAAKIMPIPVDITPRLSIIAPCTFDPQRLPMLKSLVERAKEENVELTLVGKDHGVLGKLKLHRDVMVLPEMNHDALVALMELYDEVAGLHIGTVTIEAWFLNKKTSVYDLEGNWKYVERPEDYLKHHYKEIAKLI